MSFSWRSILSFRCIHHLVLAISIITAGATNASAKELDWHHFEVAGRPAFMILPNGEKRCEPMPWVMYAPTFDRGLPNESHEGWMIRQWLDAGIAIAGVDVGESFGSPAGRESYDALHAHLTNGSSRFKQRACLLARSRGGLMLYNWAAENPNKVSCIAGIYPVCDLRSYPGLARACGAYGMTESELADVLTEHNPVDRLAPLAKANIPLFHIHGDIDKVVPLESNSGAVAKRYQTLGGRMELVIAPGQGHNMWNGFFQCQALVDFVISHAPGKASQIELPKPIAHWALDEAEGDIAQDSAGEHHGKIVGASATSGKIEGARLFDRSKRDHVSIDYSKQFELSTFTVSAWVKLTRPPTFSGILGTRFGGECTFDMKVNDAKVHGDIGDGKSWIETKVNFYADDTGSNEQGGDLALGEWFHIVYVIDNERQQCRLYLDADLKKTIAFKGTPRLMQPGQEMRIGNSSSDEFMDGIIDDVRIWATALTEPQVRMLYGSTTRQLD
ncbi:MAG: prolyl oligopeptidase family serine peptidase [Planctomycetes bacterium]|nr:prolyl oligopeptidase family serine peptidase [Planctomycetota bacterium]